MSALILSLVTLAIFALPTGAYALWRRGGSRLQVALMLLAAVVLAVNAALLMLPGPGQLR